MEVKAGLLPGLPCSSMDGSEKLDEVRSLNFAGNLKTICRISVCMYNVSIYIYNEMVMFTIKLVLDKFEWRFSALCFAKFP